MTVTVGCNACRLLKAGIGLFEVAAGAESTRRCRGHPARTRRPASRHRRLPREPLQRNGVGLASCCSINWAAGREPTPERAGSEGLSRPAVSVCTAGTCPSTSSRSSHVVDVQGPDAQRTRAAPATLISKHLGAIASLLQLAADDGLCAVNVASGIRVRGRKVPEEAELPIRHRATCSESSPAPSAAEAAAVLGWRW